MHLAINNQCKNRLSARNFPQPGQFAVIRFRLICIFIGIDFLYSYRFFGNIWIHPRCNCMKGFTNSLFKLIPTSTCPSADFRGPNQKVVSYSFYGDTASGYFQGVPINAERIASLYPGWTMRLYHDIQPSNVSAMSDLCREVCTFPHLDECYVGDIETQFENITTKFGMLWRFVVLGDPTVDVFAVRDLDSQIYQREVDAVNDWLARGKTWHIMRDNPVHVTHILGGMWGAKNTRNVTAMAEICRDIMDQPSHHRKAYDQRLLSEMVWPAAKKDMVAHDSFLCKSYPNTTPWPTARINREFVGDMPGLSIYEQCPVECRPKDHQDWIYC